MFSYCPKCSSNQIALFEDKKFKCSDCDFVYFHNVAGAVAVIIKQNNKILFTVRNQEPQKGKLDLPGGFIDPKESAEECCVRELYEELFVKIPIEKLHYLDSEPNTYLYKNILYNTIDLFYEININIKIEKIEESELQNIIWLSLHEVNIEDIAFLSQRKMIKELQNRQ